MNIKEQAKAMAIELGNESYADSLEAVLTIAQSRINKLIKQGVSPVLAAKSVIANLDQLIHEVLIEAPRRVIAMLDSPEQGPELVEYIYNRVREV